MARFPNPQALTELDIVQNPAVGAYLVWQFGLAFQVEGGEPAPLPAAFLVLPLILHEQTLDVILSTLKASGLMLFASKVGEQKEDLLAIHNRALKLRTLTLRSIGFAVNAGLATVDYQRAAMRSNTPVGPVRRLDLPERLRGFPRAAEKIGAWFARVPLTQVASTLRISF